METKKIIDEGLKGIDFDYTNGADIENDSSYRGLAASFYKEIMKEVLAKAIKEQAIVMATTATTQSDIDFNRGVIQGLLMIDEWFKGRLNSLLAEEKNEDELINN